MESSDIMTVEEVAEYLRVSDRTVYAWAQKGEIPCGKFGSTWRFKRDKVEEWVNARLGVNKPRPGARPIPLRDILSADRVLVLDCTRKVEALDALIACLAQAPNVSDRDELAEGIFRREDLMSTGIGLGVAVPHVRLASITDIAMAAALCRLGVEDYESLDNEPVRMIFMVGAGQDQHAQHIKLLAALSSRFKDPVDRTALMNAGDPKEFYRLLTEGVS